VDRGQRSTRSRCPTVEGLPGQDADAVVAAQGPIGGAGGRARQDGRIDDEGGTVQRPPGRCSPGAQRWSSMPSAHSTPWQRKPTPGAGMRPRPTQVRAPSQRTLPCTGEEERESLPRHGRSRQQPRPRQQGVGGGHGRLIYRACLTVTLLSSDMSPRRREKWSGPSRWLQPTPPTRPTFAWRSAHREARPQHPTADTAAWSLVIFKLALISVMPLPLSLVVRCACL